MYVWIAVVCLIVSTQFLANCFYIDAYQSAYPYSVTLVVLWGLLTDNCYPYVAFFF